MMPCSSPLRVPSEGLPLRITVSGPGVILIGKPWSCPQAKPYRASIAEGTARRLRWRQNSAGVRPASTLAPCTAYCPWSLGLSCARLPPFRKWRQLGATQILSRSFSVAKVTGAYAFTLKGFNPAKPVRVFHAPWAQARSRVHVSPPAALVGFQLGGSTGRCRA